MQVQSKGKINSKQHGRVVVELLHIWESWIPPSLKEIVLYVCREEKVIFPSGLGSFDYKGFDFTLLLLAPSSGSLPFSLMTSRWALVGDDLGLLLLFPWLKVALYCCGTGPCLLPYGTTPQLDHPSLRCEGTMLFQSSLNSKCSSLRFPGLLAGSKMAMHFLAFLFRPFRLTKAPVRVFLVFGVEYKDYSCLWAFTYTHKLEKTH